VQCTPRRCLHSSQVQLTLGLPTWLSDFSGIGEADWAFKTSFDAGDPELSAPNVELVFEGLDTFSVVTLVSRTFMSDDAIGYCSAHQRNPFPERPEHY
jgi:hypothetical protein